VSPEYRKYHNRAIEAAPVTEDLIQTTMDFQVDLEKEKEPV
jgi:hypothetical protein